MRACPTCTGSSIKAKPLHVHKLQQPLEKQQNPQRPMSARERSMPRVLQPRPASATLPRARGGQRPASAWVPRSCMGVGRPATARPASAQLPTSARPASGRPRSAGCRSIVPGAQRTLLMSAGNVACRGNDADNEPDSDVALWLQDLIAAGVLVTPDLVERLAELPEDHAAYLVCGALATRKDLPRCDIGAILLAATRSGSDAAVPATNIDPKCTASTNCSSRSSSSSPPRVQDMTQKSPAEGMSPATDRVFVLPLGEKWQERLCAEADDPHLSAAKEEIAGMAAWASTIESKEPPMYAQCLAQPALSSAERLSSKLISAERLPSKVTRPRLGRSLTVQEAGDILCSRRSPVSDVPKGMAEKPLLASTKGCWEYLSARSPDYLEGWMPSQQQESCPTAGDLSPVADTECQPKTARRKGCPRQLLFVTQESRRVLGIATSNSRVTPAAGRAQELIKDEYDKYMNRPSRLERAQRVQGRVHRQSSHRRP